MSKRVRRQGAEAASGVAIDEAVAWLAATPPAARPRPIVPHLRKMFGLSAAGACAALSAASRSSAS